MEVLKNLHVSIAETCEKSFDTAYQDLQSQINNLQKRAEEAETKAAAAFAGQQAAEEANKGLQSNISALQEQLRHFETKPEDLDLPKQFARLEDDFAPEHVWTRARPGSGSGRDSYSREELEEILENKYATLYANIQTLTDGWSTLKSKVLQHKKKLRHVDRQLAKNEFTLVLNGVPVTFRRTEIANANPENDDYVPVSFNETITNPATSFTSTSTTTPANQIRGAETGTGGDTSVRIKRERQSQIDLTQHPDPEPAPAAENQLSAEPSSSQISPDALQPPPLPSIRNCKRKRVLAAGDDQPAEIIPERSPPRKIKNEPISSSPSRHSIQPPEQHFPSTQDLDHISYVVQTPTKPKPKAKPQRMDFDDIQEEEEEDGVEPEPVSRSKKKKRPDNRAHSRAQSSASVLNPVNGNSQGRQSTTEPSDRKKKVKNQRHQNNPSARETSNTGRTSYDRNMTQSSQSQPDITADSYPTIHPEEEPYRLLPLHMLTLSHFKINPDGNQGMDYAYSNVVRKKEERKCLSGCTRPGCCGDRFRAMARLGGIPSGSEEENNLILEEYLGEEGQRHRIDRLSVEERNRLLVEAKARKFANQYGKHRHAHQRARTPPGFWRTDMPDTQELEADALDAERFEREKVEERYREAMRPGGLWTWADE